MGLRYRKKVKVAPGVYLNMSKTGTSTTIKLGNGMSLNMGNNGTYLNSGIPGTGIYSREKIIGGGSKKENSNTAKIRYEFYNPIPEHINQKINLI